MVQGVIERLRRRQGFGFTRRRYKIFFRREAIEGDRFDQLREGQQVEFVESADPRDPQRMRGDRVFPSEE